MTTVHWLISADLRGGYRDELVARLRAAGHGVRLIEPPRPPYRWEDAGCPYREAFPPEACVVTHGDIELVDRVTRERLWTPGAFATIEHYFCSHYYRRFKGRMLNQNCVWLPFSELGHRRDALFRTVGLDDALFIRPDSPLKLFTGQVARGETFDADLELMAFYEFPADSLVLVSAPRRLLAEWRFIVAARQVVAGCRYKTEGRREVEPGYDAGAFDLAAQIAGEDYQPDPVWVADICRTDDGAYHLLEVGGFSFADLYACDLDAIARSVSGVAEAEWLRARGALNT